MLDHPKRLRRAAGLAAIAALTVPGISAIAAPRGVHDGRTKRQTTSAYHVEFSKNLASGVRLTRYSSRPDGRRAISDVLTASLGTAGVSAGILSGAVTETAPMSTWASRSNAVAAVNGDYFDISSSQAPNGTIVRGGRILKGVRSGQEVVGQGRDGRLRADTVYLDSTLRWSGRTRSVDFYNTVLSRSSLPSDGISVLDSEWGSAPLRIPHAAGRLAVVAVGADHRVIRTYRKISGQRVPAGGMLIVATGSDARLGRLRRGTLISERVGMRTSAPAAFAWGLGYGLSLMHGGSVIHNWPNDSDPRDARTALGWRDGGRTMVLVTVEYGRGSAGEEVNAIADELAAQGATDGVLLDGGGSTTLVARGGAHPLTQIGPVSNAGNVERHVPIGIGVFVTRHAG